MSWKHLTSDYPNPLTYEEKVDVFYEQTLGWQLHIADLIANGGLTFGLDNTGDPSCRVPPIQHSGFAVLHICLSYFELVGSLFSPKKTSDTERFKRGVREVLPGLFTGTPDDDALLKRLHKGARCGLYHTGRTHRLVGLGQPPDGSPIAYDPKSGSLVVSPERLPLALKSHLDGLTKQLKDRASISLHKRFEELFDAGFE